MPEYVNTIFGLMGGLALFLYGMNNMSEALQKTAGERMKSVLGFLTKTPLMGALAGALVTAILQSSSATTVMVIGFVSAGLMGLPQAISVIFGANIGTTMTAQLIAFDISDYIYPIIFLGFFIAFISKKEQVKNIAMVVFYFGVLFEGIEIMSSVMKPLAQSPIFTDLMGKVRDIPILGVLLGMVMTLVVQSSSATIAVLQRFAAQAGADGVTSVIGLAGAIPILLGDNIGTTITALLASIGQSRNARRTALAHSFFNISGAILFGLLLPWFSKVVALISPKGPEIEVISRQIANAHTLFNISMTLIWLPLLPVMVQLVLRLVPGQDSSESQLSKTIYLDHKMIGQPTAALYLVSREIERCIASVEGLFPLLRDRVGGKIPAVEERTFDEAYAGTKAVQKEVIHYLSEMFTTGALSQEQSEQAAGLLSVINAVDRVSDRLADVLHGAREAEDTQYKLSKTAKKELDECMEAAQKIFGQAVDLLRLVPGDEKTLPTAQAIAKGKNKLRKAAKQFHKSHLARVKAGKCDDAMTPIYGSMLYNIGRIGDNCVAISEECLEEVHLLHAEDVGIAAPESV